MTKLQVFGYKNHEESYFEFCSGINCITGPNGSGKTNILDAVYYLGNARSFFNAIDQQVVKHGSPAFSVHGWFSGETDAEILIHFNPEKGKKTIKKNGKTYPRILDHIGLIQTVFITPYDISLVLEGSEERRRFLDFTLCQTNREYLEALAFYKKIQEQRNAYLKKCERTGIDEDILDSFDARLIPAAKKIHHCRMDFVKEFLPWFHEIHSYLSDKKDMVSLQYESELNDNDYANLLRQNREKDRILMRTGSGIHKDDLLFFANDFPLKKFGSQGQIKTYVIALKLAQYRYYVEKTGHIPILLLDDIFEKIDARRADKLMELVAQEKFGQILITDTHAGRVKDHLETVGGEKRYFEIGE